LIPPVPAGAMYKTAEGPVLYDSQGDVVNFGETYESALEGGETLDFEICIEPPNQNAARHELYAWGQ